MSTYCMVCTCCDGKDRHEPHTCGMEHRFREETVQDQVQYWVLVPHGQQVSIHSWHREKVWHTFLVLQANAPLPSGPERDSSVRCLSHSVCGVLLCSPSRLRQSCKECDGMTSIYLNIKCYHCLKMGNFRKYHKPTIRTR